MYKKILTAAGFIENKTFKESRFLKPPKETYAVFFDAFNRRGADTVNLIKDHDGIIELYSYVADPVSEANIEHVLDEFAIEYDKAPRYWIQDEQLFQVVYTFKFIEK